MEYLILTLLYTLLLAADYLPGRKSRGRKANVIYVVLASGSLIGMLYALSADIVPTLTGILEPLRRWLV